MFSKHSVQHSKNLVSTFFSQVLSAYHYFLVGIIITMSLPTQKSVTTVSYAPEIVEATAVFKNYSALSKAKIKGDAVEVKQLFIHRNSPFSLEFFPRGSKVAKDGNVSLFLRHDGPVGLKYYYTLRLTASGYGMKDYVQDVRAHTRWEEPGESWGWLDFFAVSNVEKASIVTIDLKVFFVDGGISIGRDVVHHDLTSSRVHDFAGDLSQMLAGEVRTDMVVVVQGTRIPVHSCILAARSPVFAAALSSDCKGVHANAIQH